MATKSLLWMIYGGAFRLYVQVYSKFGIKIKFVDTTNPENVQNAITPNTKLIWFESPTNPLLKISDIEQICKIAKENNVLVCVDNTFASPFFERLLFANLFTLPDRAGSID